MKGLQELSQMYTALRAVIAFYIFTQVRWGGNLKGLSYFYLKGLLPERTR